MKTIIVNNFARGIADDKTAGRTGEFAVAKHFDILTNPRRLQPLRGMAAHTGSTGIGNLLVASDGAMYGIGLDIAGGNPTLGKLFVLDTYGGSGSFGALSTNQLSGDVADYDFFVDWPDCSVTPGTNVRKIYWAAANRIVTSNYSGGAGSATHKSLTFSSIGQGFVHPKDKKLYFPYSTTSNPTPYIGVFSPSDVSIDDGAYAGLAATAFQLSILYRSYCLTNYGNYLAIPLTSQDVVSNVNSSLVGLWDRDTTNPLFSETIPWGVGSLRVLNNLAGALIGVSQIGSDSTQANTCQDYNAIQIKVWNGGAEPTLVAELKAIVKSGSSSFPTVSINPRVNFINNNRLYFSVNINPNDGVQPSRIGLWSVGKNKITGEWTVNLERVATNDNSETSVIAAAIVGDYIEIVHTAAGTLTKTINGNASSLTYAATSVYESCVNPDMPPLDDVVRKQLDVMGSTFLPLPTGASVLLKYRVDSSGSDSDWITVATASTVGSTFIEMPNASGSAFTAGTNYEFRLESMGGAVITSLTYKYETLTSLLT